jgi:hypothetical protein
MASSEDPLEASAAARQEAFLAGRTVAARSREVHEDVSNLVVELVATIDPYEEKVGPLNPEDEEGFSQNAQIAISFVELFDQPRELDPVTPAALDRAFAGWLEATDTHGFSPEAVVAVLGSAFGKYCAETLRMRWAQVQEGESTSFAVIAKDCDVRAYPFDMIAKRLPTRETGFIESVYLVLKNRVAEAAAHGDA